MNKDLVKKIIKWLIIIALLALVIYGGYVMYQHIMESLVKNVAKGVVKGVGEGIANTFNPFK